VAPGWLATEAARRALPATVPHPDAVANAARSALLVAALSAAPPDPAEPTPGAAAAPGGAGPSGSGAIGVRGVPGEHRPRDDTVSPGASADPAVLFDATEDYLHQRYRAAVMPETADLLGRLRDARLPAVLSGAGPSVLVLMTADPQAGHGLVDSIARETGIAWRVTPLEIDRHGAAAQSPWPGADSPASSWRMHPEGREQHPGTSPAETSPHDNAASAVTRGRP
jgi:homoserine kinase